MQELLVPLLALVMHVLAGQTVHQQSPNDHSGIGDPSEVAGVGAVQAVWMVVIAGDALWIITLPYNVFVPPATFVAYHRRNA